MFEPTDIELAIYDRGFVTGFRAIGPLTKEQFESEQAFEAYEAAREAEHEAYEEAGYRSVCDSCGERAVKARDVLTYGHRRHPEAEYTVMRKCEACGKEDM